MKKQLAFTFLALAGCANSSENHFQANGNTVSLDDFNCSYVQSNYSAGLVFTEYSSKYNKVKINGVSSGLVVNNYIAGSPADIASFPLAVSIVRANGIDITSAAQFTDLLKSSPNSSIEIEYIGNRQSGKKMIKAAKGETYINNCKFQYKYKTDEYLKNA